MEKVIKVEFTPEQWGAILIACAQLENGGEWTQYYSQATVETVFQTIDYIKKIKQ